MRACVVLLLVAALAAPASAAEIGGGGEPPPGSSAVGMIIGFPQLVAVQCELSVGRDLDLGLHAGSLILLGSLGARLRWCRDREGTHPYAFAGAAMVSVLMPHDTGQDSRGGAWLGAGLEWRGRHWKWQIEGGTVLLSHSFRGPTAAVGLAWLL